MGHPMDSEIDERLRLEAAQRRKAWDHPTHYGGADNPYEVIKVIEAWWLDFHLGNAVKYIARAGKKDPAKEIEDLEKARWYIDRKIAQLQAQLVKKD